MSGVNRRNHVVCGDGVHKVKLQSENCKYHTFILT